MTRRLVSLLGVVLACAVVLPPRVLLAEAAPERTDDDVDGVDFKVSDRPAIIRFVLEIDGRPRPAEVEVGRANFMPNENPLTVRFR